MTERKKSRSIDRDMVDETLTLPPRQAGRLREAFRQMDLLVASDEPEEGLNCLLAMIRELRAVRRELS